MSKSDRSKKNNLSKYRTMRSPSGTTEPFGSGKGTGASIFVVQQHAARQLHFDFRLEMDGVLRSWAVPRGPSNNQKDKRLAVKVEDHPIEYADFEGVIPTGNYGAGHVVLWDRGNWVPVDDPEEGLKKGKLLFDLYGYKLKGRWTLVKIKKSEKDWLLIKEKDAYLSDQGGIEEFSPNSVLSGITLEEYKKGNSRITKIERKLNKLKLPSFDLDPTKHKIQPMLAQVKEKPFSHPDWLFEIKYDGYRMIAVKDGGSVELFTRNGNPITDTFPEIKQSLEALPSDSFIIDGEIVILNDESRPEFRLLQNRIRTTSGHRISVSSLRRPASFFAFDLIKYDQHDLRGLPLVQRKELLQLMLGDVGPVRYSDHFLKNGEKVYQHATQLRLEGLIAKKARSKYISGRSANWLKIRADKTGDFIVIGFTQPKRSRPSFGSLILAGYLDGKLTYCGRVGTGFSSSQLKSIRQELDEQIVKKKPVKGDVPDSQEIIWVKPQMIVEVRFKEMVDALRQSAFLRIRDDKPLEDCLFPEEKKPLEVPKSIKAKTSKKVELSNLQKIFWPEDKLTKGDLIDYYDKISPWLLPYLKNRPVVLTRYPDGIMGKSFYQKDAPVFTPKWIKTHGVWTEHSEREIKYFICNDRDTLKYIANLGTIPLHIWHSSLPKLEKPDYCVLDLDPKGAPFNHVVEVALAIQNLCQEIRYPCYVKTSGSSGLHILLPTNKKFSHDQVKTLGEIMANHIASQVLPHISTTVRNPKKRDGKVYVDFLQNGHGKLIAAPFCVRPLQGAPVSMPLKWSEVNKKLDIKSFTIKTTHQRMAQLKQDPVVKVLRDKPDLEQILDRLHQTVQSANMLKKQKPRRKSR